MDSPRSEMTEAEEEALLDELLDQLERVVKTSGCRDMFPLWMQTTGPIRRRHFRSITGPALDTPRHILDWGKAKRSKYGTLACWRHAVLSADILAAVRPFLADAIEAMYFTPAEKNAPPYSWSNASSRHPRAGEWPSPTAFDQRARQACRESVRLIAEQAANMKNGASLADDARADLLALGARDGSLRDILRYESLGGDR